ncbi:ThiF family adenylyltransferase [Chitinophaga deserti]|uniref:ThiF family adenylyltransferase n=1 Tax=Chitinophaga deserti TaxID=2164099 RepID=UPI000D6C3260|nr:ThiF family adenylyltransferase [Chitinophaga deserti]
MNRYDRQIRLEGFGIEKQEMLRNAAVLVIGAGGLGVPVLQYLTAMGVGKIGIAEEDTVSVTNLQRQVIYTTADEGKPKIQAAIARLEALNPDTVFVPHPYYLSTANALDIIAPYDLVVDCSDNFGTRYLINDACVILSKPFIYGSIFRYEGQVSVLNYNGSGTYRCLFPEPGDAPDCNDVGVLGVLPGIIGCYQASEAVKVLTGIGEPLANQLLTVQLLDNTHQVFSFHAQPGNHDISALQDSYGNSVCDARTMQLLTVQELKEWLDEGRDFQLIDVREKDEWDYCHIEGAVHIPMRRVAASLSTLARDTPVAMICHHGMRSRATAELLLQAGFPDVYNVSGGIHAWAREIDTTMAVY